MEKKTIILVLLLGFMMMTCEKSVQNIESDKTPDSYIELIFVAGDTFLMGNTLFDEMYNVEHPVHPVVLSDYYIGKYEVTQCQWNSVMDYNPSLKRGDDRPVEQCDWFEAVACCNALSLENGFTPCYTIDGYDVTCDFEADGYRLPTEAEWEYAAKGGNKSQGYLYAGSDDIEEVGWYLENYEPDIHTHNVGGKKPNELGIYDMSGNCSEWCWDYFDFYTDELQIDPTGPDSSQYDIKYRVLRNGGYYDPIERMPVTYRRNRDPLMYYHGVSFRVVRKP